MFTALLSPEPPSSITETKQLHEELSQMRDVLSNLKNQYQSKSNEILSKQYELQRRMEKKAHQEEASENNSHHSLNMMQKLEYVMQWAKKLEDECTRTKRQRRLEERRSSLQLKLKRRRRSLGAENDENLGGAPRGTYVRFSANALMRIDSENLMMQIPPSSGRHLSNITNVLPTHNLKYVESLQADLDELNAALKPAPQGKSKPTLIRRLSEADMPLYMQKGALSQQHYNPTTYVGHAYAVPQPPSAPSNENNHYQRRYIPAHQDVPDCRRSVNALPARQQAAPSVPQRPKSEIYFTSDQKHKRHSNMRYAHEVHSDEDDAPRSRSRKSQPQRRSKSTNKKQAPKRDKVKRLYGQATPEKSPPKKNFRRLLSKSKQLEIDRKLRNLMR